MLYPIPGNQDKILTGICEMPVKKIAIKQYII